MKQSQLRLGHASIDPCSMSLRVKELRPGIAAGAVDIVLVDEHDHERLLRVSDDGVLEVEQGMFVPVSDELEAMARAALAARPQLGGSASDHPSVSGETGAFAAIPDGVQVSRPHVGTGEVQLGGPIDEAEKVWPEDSTLDGGDDDS